MRLWLILVLATTLAMSACRRGGGGAPPGDPEPSDRTEIPSLDVPTASSAIEVDGELGEDAWRNAARTPAFVHPGNGAFRSESNVNATALLTWDEDALYLAFEVADRDPASPFGRDDLDPHVWSASSGIELMLQPGDPGNNTHYYEVQVDTEEAVWDTHFDDYNNPVTGEGENMTFGHQEWSAQLDRAALVHEDGYVIEMALPWDVIDGNGASVPPAAGDTWRANFYTFRDGQRDSLAWSAIMGEGNFHFSGRFGRVTFGE